MHKFFFLWLKVAFIDLAARGSATVVVLHFNWQRLEFFCIYWASNGFILLTGAVLVISVPGNSSHETDGGQNRYHAMKAVIGTSILAKGPVSRKDNTIWIKLKHTKEKPQTQMCNSYQITTFCRAFNLSCSCFSLNVKKVWQMERDQHRRSECWSGPTLRLETTELKYLRSLYMT